MSQAARHDPVICRDLTPSWSNHFLTRCGESSLSHCATSAQRIRHHVHRRERDRRKRDLSLPGKTFGGPRRGIDRRVARHRSALPSARAFLCGARRDGGTHGRSRSLRRTRIWTRRVVRGRLVRVGYIGGVVGGGRERRSSLPRCVRPVARARCGGGRRHGGDHRLVRRAQRRRGEAERARHRCAHDREAGPARALRNFWPL